MLPGACAPWNEGRVGRLVPRDQLQARGACPGHKDQGPVVSGTPEPSPGSGGCRRPAGDADAAEGRGPKSASGGPAPALTTPDPETTSAVLGRGRVEGLREVSDCKLLRQKPPRTPEGRSQPSIPQDSDSRGHGASWAHRPAPPNTLTLGGCGAAGVPGLPPSLPPALPPAPHPPSPSLPPPRPRGCARGHPASSGCELGRNPEGAAAAQQSFELMGSLERAPPGSPGVGLTPPHDVIGARDKKRGYRHLGLGGCPSRLLQHPGPQNLWLSEVWGAGLPPKHRSRHQARAAARSRRK